MSVAVRPSLSHRYFFALKPDEVTGRRTHVFAGHEIGPAHCIRPEHQHMTLAITDDFSEPFGFLVEALRRAGDAVAGDPFVMDLDRLSASRGSVALRPSHIVPPLNDLQARLARAMTEMGVPMRRDWRFSPHQTLGYREGEPFSRLLPGFRWHVAEFVLVHSHVGRTRHEILGRWPLRGRPRDAQLSLFG